MLSVAERFDNRPGRLYSFVGHKAPLMTVWVTGANGFIGRHLARALADAGHTVHGIGHGAMEELDKERLGLKLWLNGEIDATNLSALAIRQRIAIDDLPSGRRIIGRIVDRATL